jgi:hypothetical protein
MPGKRKFIKHHFAGGWATDFGPVYDGAPDRGGFMSIPFLVKAENVFFELDGAPHKVGGVSKLNSSVLESGATIMGLHDMWISGISGTPTQHRVVVVGTVIMKDDADGSFSNIFTGKVSGAIPDFEVFDDLLIIANDASADVPMSWDGTTAQNLAGTPPNFAFSTTHLAHLFAAGVDANPSTLYWSAPFDPEDWAGAGSGNIKVDPDDGDRITAIISHKKRLFIFKGPYTGSIHILTGTSSSDFALELFIKKVGAVAQRLTFPFKDDIAFMWSDGSVRTLSATDRFGDFSENSLSVPINRGFLGSKITFSSLAKGQAVDDGSAGYVLFTIPINGSTDNNVVLMMDYRFMTDTEPVRWAQWTKYDDASCIASVIDPTDSNRRIIMGGHQDGFVRKWNINNRNFDGADSISAIVTTPFVNYGLPAQMKTLGAASLSVAVKNSGDIIFGWTRDTMPQQSVAISQGGSGAVLGSAGSNQFVLGTSTLGANDYADKFTALEEEGGEFRSIQYEIANAAFNEDIEIHGIGAFISSGAESTEN